MHSHHQFIFDLVSIPSISQHEKQAAAFLVQHMKKIGYEQAFIDKAGNAVGIRGSGKKQIVLLGHIDTVPGHIPVHIADNQLFGRGSVDAKGALAAFTIAASQLSTKDLADKQIIVIGAVEEEITTSKGVRFVLDQYQPQYCIIGEPSSWNGITLGYKGILNFTYTNRADLLHHSQAGATPIKKGLQFIAELETYVHHYKKVSSFDSPVLEIRSINSEENGQQQIVSLECAIRIPPEFNHQELKDFIEGKKHSGTISYTQELFGILETKSNELVALFLDAIRQCGGQPCFKKKTGSSDMCITKVAWTCPTIAYGPGDAKLDHTPTEHLDLGEYQKAITILYEVLEKL